MRNQTFLALLALAISVATSAASQPKKEQCPTQDLDAIETLIREAPSCLRAVAIFESCQFGAGGDVGLGAAVTEKCEGDFLSKLSAAQKRIYDRKQKRCLRKYQSKVGTMYRSFEAFCSAYVARDYSAKFLRATPQHKQHK